MSTIMDAVPFTRAACLFPSRPSVGTMWRWVLQGVRGPGEQRVKLRTLKIGGRAFITPEMAEAFIAALNEPDVPADEPATAKRRASEAGKALEKLGC